MHLSNYPLAHPIDAMGHPYSRKCEDGNASSAFEKYPCYLTEINILGKRSQYGRLRVRLEKNCEQQKLTIFEENQVAVCERVSHVVVGITTKKWTSHGPTLFSSVLNEVTWIRQDSGSVLACSKNSCSRDLLAS